jgi:hypothetical protein
MKKSRRDEPNWAIMHIKWKCQNETFCVVILNKQKCHFFLLQNQRTRGQNRSYLGRLVHWEKERTWRKDVGG